MKLYNDNPNFSIVVPALCNASCQFCFWKSMQHLKRTAYTMQLVDTMALLPAQFQQCSITGGEPMLLDWIDELCELVSKRFPKVVLSTNGSRFTYNVLKHICHLNLSRHDVDDARNRAVFQSEEVPDHVEVEAICHEANHEGVDVTLNCVLAPGFSDAKWIRNYIAFGRHVGASAVCFRKEHSDLTGLPVRKVFASKLVESTTCPVCRTETQLIYGMRVVWKYSVAEPSDLLDQVYELVFHPNGSLTTDWAGQRPVKLEAPSKRSSAHVLEDEAPPKRYRSTSGHGCYGSSGGGC